MRSLGAVGVLGVLAAWWSPSTGHAAMMCGPVKRTIPVRACYVDPAFDPQALCNDGTTPAFWYRQGSGSGINTWVFWMEGGGFCDSQASCQLRTTKSQAATTLTSNGFTTSPGEGIQSPAVMVNPVLDNANQVLLHYCSSDTWVGNQAGNGQPFDPNDSTTWNFEGRRIAVAQIQSVYELAPSLASATKVIIGGTSSGGIGAVDIANDLIPLMPPAALKMVVSDAGFLLDIGQFNAKAPFPYIDPEHPNQFEIDLPLRLSYWNAHGDAVCDAAAVTQQDHVNCYNTSFVLQNGYIQAPVFVAESQLDTAQITEELCPDLFGYCQISHNADSREGEYATAFAQQMATLIEGHGTQATYTAYAPDVYTHVILDNNTAFLTPEPFAKASFPASEVFNTWVQATSWSKQLYIGTGPGVQ
jgi:hypothetical protein